MLPLNTVTNQPLWTHHSAQTQHKLKLADSSTRSLVLSG